MQNILISPWPHAYDVIRLLRDLRVITHDQFITAQIVGIISAHDRDKYMEKI